MSFNYAELSRFIGYVAGIFVGLGFVTYGLLNGDLTTALAGASTLGVSVTAAPNVNKTASPDTSEELPGKHREKTEDEEV